MACTLAVREALCKFFGVEGEMSHEQVERIRQVVAPRLQALQEGSTPLQEFDAAFAEIERAVLE